MPNLPPKAAPSAHGLVGLGLTVAVVTDLLFYERPAGWTVGLYGALLLALIFLPAILRHRHIPRPALVLTCLLVPLCLLQAWHLSLIAALLTGIGIVAVQWTLRAGWTASGTVWLARLLNYALCGWLRVFLDQQLLGRRRAAPPPAVAAGLLRRWALPLAMSLVFVILFAIANPVIARWLETLRSELEEFIEQLTFPAFERILLWGGVFILAWGLVRLRPTGRRLPQATMKPVPPRLGAESAAPLILRCLLLFNAIFAVQNLLDARYLMGGASLPAGMTYAQYAHRGAYPLIATALLAAAFILWAFAPGGPGERSPLARRLVYFWVAQNIFLMASAAWRLAIYIECYSLTRWRAAAGVWMLLVALGLAAICLRIVLRRQNLWLINANLLQLLAILYLCAFVNWPGVIAMYNARHCEDLRGRGNGPALDFHYMQHLGVEAIPALLWYQAQRPQEAHSRAFADTLAALTDRLAQHHQDWRGWTLSGERIWDQLPRPLER